MRFRDLRYLWYTDLYRYSGRAGLALGIKHLASNPGFQYTFWMRSKAYFAQARPRVLAAPFWALSALILRHYTYKFGISIPSSAAVGCGLHIGHFGGIVVNEHATIGRNCNISHGVTLGQANRGRNEGYPCIGDNVYIGPGAKIVGAVRVGDNAAIGANCVVTRDVPDHGVAVGMPNKVISFEGSAGYVNNTDYLAAEHWFRT